MDGRTAARALVGELATELDRLGSPPVTLATVVVGGGPPEHRDAGRKHRAAAEAGMRIHHLALPADISQDRLEGTLVSVAADPAVHGVFLQLPVPECLDSASALDGVPLDKDVDGLSRESLALLRRGRPVHIPAAALALRCLLARYEIPLSGRDVVVVGTSPVVTVALILTLAGQGAMVTLADPDSPDLPAITRGGDILVSAAGRPGLITAAHVRPGAAVVDAGSVDAVARALAPMPGGLGPMTVACLLRNTVEAARRLGALG